MPLDLLPPDSQLETISLALLPSVLQAIERKRRARKKVRWSVAGIGAVVLVSGALAGVALLAPVFNPGGGELYGSNGKLQPASFAVSCFATVTHDTMDSLEQQYDSQDRINAITGDFKAACNTIREHAELQNAISQAAQNQQEAGLSCGIIRVTGGQTAYWRTVASAEQPKTFEVATSTAGMPSGCDTTVSISPPKVTVGNVAVCAIASNWAAVYPRGREDSRTICDRAGYTVWAN